MIPEQAIEAAIDAALAVRRQQHVNGTAGRHYQEIVAALEAALPFLASAARQPQRISPTVWPDVPRRQ